MAKRISKLGRLCLCTPRPPLACHICIGTQHAGLVPSPTLSVLPFEFVAASRTLPCSQRTLRYAGVRLRDVVLCSDGAAGVSAAHSAELSARTWPSVMSGELVAEPPNCEVKARTNPKLSP